MNRTLQRIVERSKLCWLAVYRSAGNGGASLTNPSQASPRLKQERPRKGAFLIGVWILSEFEILNSAFHAVGANMYVNHRGF